MKLEKGIFIILLFFYCQLEAKVINPILKHYNMNNGLVDNYVTAIHQDRQGYIWIGTRLGVNRFDGYQFKTYGGDIDNVWVRSMSSDNPLHINSPQMVILVKFAQRNILTFYLLAIKCFEVIMFSVIYK